MTIPPVIRSKKIAVLYGGWSEEKEISRKSGAAILKALQSLGLNVVGMEVDSLLTENLRKRKIDFCFLALHGRYGEDGTVQGLLEMMRIPYTGSGVLSCALSINKAISKIVFQSQGIPTAPFVVVCRGEIPKKKFPFPYPIVVKPVDSGSAIGVTIVQESSQLRPALKGAWRYSSTAIVEKFILGREITAPIFGEKVLPLIEIIPKGSFYDFASKYEKGGSRHIIPAPITSRAKEKISQLALRAHKGLFCKGCSRVDFILDKNEKPWVLELNSIPGMTETSLYPESAKFAGYSFQDLVLEMIKLNYETV